MSDLVFEDTVRQTSPTENLVSKVSAGSFALQTVGVEQLSVKTATRDLLRALEEHKVENIVPQLTSEGALVYPEITKLTGIDTSQVSDILEALSLEGVLTKKLVNPLINCPQCSSTVLAQSIVCPNCHGTDLVGGTALQHLPCLKFDFESNFKHQDGSTFCPKCDRKLLNLGSDYYRPGIFFKCFTCGEFTARTLRVYTCESCQNVFETTEESMTQAYEYAVNHDRKEIISKYRVETIFPMVLETVTICGLKAASGNILTGKSGVVHSFSVLSKYKGVEDIQGLVAIDVVSNPVSVGSNAVLSLFAKALDCKLRNTVLIALPELDADARVLARNYNVTYIEAGRSLEEAAAKLQALLKQREFSLGLSRKNPRSGQAEKSGKRRQSKRRGTHDIMVDILKVITSPSSKTQVMACANLSFDQCQNYLPAMEKLGLLTRSIEDGVHTKYTIAEKGREYLLNMSADYGSIADGHKSVWTTRGMP